jgi:hypothetical protein
MTDENKYRILKDNREDPIYRPYFSPTFDSYEMDYAIFDKVFISY